MRIGHRWSGLTILLVAAALLPLRTDSANANCCNVTTSLASTINAPTAGDEAFFKLPSGPANLMLLLDNSGSMGEFPQCGDNGWNNGIAACTSPTLAAPTPTPDGVNTFQAVTGTCTPSSLNSSLAWMEQVTPTTQLPDPGRSNALVADNPTWGTGCSGNNCIFDPSAYYFYGDWSASSTSTTATRRASDTDATLPAGCKLLNASGVVQKDVKGNLVDLGDSCRSCMAAHGYYFYRYSYVSSYTSRGQPRYTTGSGQMFKGTFLDANPPKFVTARKVIKDLAFMDPAAPSKMDQVRLGLTVLNCNNSSGTLVVPLGPDKTSSYPPTQANFAVAPGAMAGYA